MIIIQSLANHITQKSKFYRYLTVKKSLCENVAMLNSSL